MKFVLHDLKIGQSLEGRVAEILPDDGLIISFAGDLIRVSNETHRPLKTGDHVTVAVRATGPLRFQLLPERAEQRRRGRLDVSV